MDTLRRPQGSTAHSQKQTLPANDSAVNSATWATLNDLIAMNRHAGAISLTHSRSAQAQVAGHHLSRFRGRGMDYQESRAYQSGDDVRRMDWRVTARTGKPHIKLYQEERERPVVLFLDLNPGMYFGSRGVLKSVAAAHAAALIAWATVKRGDRVGAMLFNGGFCDLQPRGGDFGALTLIRQVIDHTEPRAGITALTHVDGLNKALARLRRVIRPGSLVVLIGDFYGIDDESGKNLQRLRQHSEVLAIQIVDPLEEEPPPAARYLVAAGGSQGVLDTRSASANQAYRDYFSSHHRAVSAMMRRHAIPLIRLSTAEEATNVMRRHFASGAKRQPPAGLVK